MKSAIFGAALIIGGCFGIAIGNLEETIFYTSGSAGTYRHGAAYFMFWAYLLLGVCAVISAMREKKKD